MPLASPSIVFVVLFTLNCVLWSSSRYAQIPHSVHGDSSLVKRIYLELGADSTSVEKQCRPLAFPPIDQCAHIQTYCPGPHTFLSIPYLTQYFCTEVTLRPLVFTGLIVWLVFLFSTLGISASDFFTPNLATIAQLLGLDENVAGVTFLAFGNGSPDVFSTFSAMRAQSGSLAIGELVGAASFIVSCVVGSMCIIKPFQLHRAGFFFRDVGFMFVAVSLLLVILWDGKIYFWEAGTMIGLYIIYALVVVVGAWWERRQDRRRAHEAMVRSEYADSDISSPRYRDDPVSAPTPAPQLAMLAPSPVRARAISAPGPPPRLQTDLPRRPLSRTPSPGPMPSFSLLGALEFRQVVASLQHEAAGSSLNVFDGPFTPYAGGHYNSLRRPRTLSRETNPWDVALNERSTPQFVVTPVLNPTDEPESYMHASIGSIPSISRTPASPTISDGDTESQTYQPPTRRQRVLGVLSEVYYTLFPALHRFTSKTVLGQIASVFAAPAVMLLTLTLPVVVTPYQSAHLSREKTTGEEPNLIDFEEEGIERILIAEEEVEEEMHGFSYNKWLTTAQCTFGPLFCAAVLSSGNLWAMLSAGIAGVALSVLVVLFGDDGEQPTFRMARCSMGFFVAIVWIMAIADEVVQVLQTFGFIFGLSDAIIGLTIFAVGNSLADLVANMSVAVFAPIMGFSACFGGPMLNILLGVGISGTYITQQTSQPYEIHFGNTLLVSTVGLLILLAATLAVVPLNKYSLTRTWGIILVLSYAVTMTVNVIVEINS
ncbi:Sodium/calcium exchanger protein-domain-containing protein [Roridomyces roridus]|uniref:Sodium/calcium exchanger protein-domain-containing protein n=1 Tax=Roridomyces roridus TaxID=1738132 RepID=A0AAD7CLM9_9AGAR|nr:Sodium/calcium exchanger protein-domain-containing protein [Roridomyces roridus]